MSSTLRRFTALAVVGLSLIAACSESTTAPQPTAIQPAAPAAPVAVAPAAPSGDLLGLLNGLLSQILLPGLQRTSPLSANITVSQTIGAAGGSLSIPAAGVTVTVPAGALSSNTVITMTARKGYLVAYDFGPHGITFNKPLVFSQKLTGTNASILTAPLLKLGYYSDPNLLTAVGGLVSELLAGNVNLLNWTFTSNIKHFSGYMVGCGRGASLDSDM